MRLFMKWLTRTMVIHLLRQGWERRALVPFGTASLQHVKRIVKKTGWAAQEGRWDWYWNNCFGPHVRIRGTTSMGCEQTACVSASWHTASLRSPGLGIGPAEMGWSGVCNLGVGRAIWVRVLYVSELGVVFGWDIDVSLLRLRCVLQICAHSQLCNVGIWNIKLAVTAGSQLLLMFRLTALSYLRTCQFVLRGKLIGVPFSPASANESSQRGKQRKKKEKKKWLKKVR